MTIKKVPGGFKLYSHTTGKPLTKTVTKAAAVKREQQIQYFKHQKGGRGK